MGFSGAAARMPIRRGAASSTAAHFDQGAMLPIGISDDVRLLVRADEVIE